MYREILNALDDWKNKENRKPLVMTGAKGVGKSYVLSDFGAGYFDNTVVFDFKTQDYVKYLFGKDRETSRIKRMLEVSCGEELLPGKSLLVFENIDILDNYFEIMMFLKEELSDFHMTFTWMFNEDKYIRLKVGKKIKENFEIIKLYAMNFGEFLIANKENSLANAIKDMGKVKISDEKLSKIHQYLKIYLFVGGLPNVVKAYVDTKDLNEVSVEKSRVLFEYDTQIENIENQTLKNKVSKIWQSIAKQLAKDNKKFQYGAVKATARAREYEDGLNWLVDNKFIDIMYRVKMKKDSNSFFTDYKSYEVFFNDTGILTAMLGMEESVVFDDNVSAMEMLEQYNGAVMLEYIYHELDSNPNVAQLYYWLSESIAKIDFAMLDEGNIIPIAIDLTNNPKAQNLKTFINMFHPEMSIKISMDDLYMKDRIFGMPVFSLWNL